MKKNLWAEREVILSDFSFSEMANLINSCDWERVASKPHLAYPLLVKEFLANFNHAIEKLEADHRTLCLAEEVPLLSHEEPENPKPPISKRTLGNPMARRAADNPAPIPVAETDRFLRQIFT
ncbi:hypothetical protein Adt_41086 [Abeliophyllum distichum]|uniref:Uncharacterized protein n=1 Tax=Abeliophyllum distichum TaxID=126358 RepID=A0ABD1PMZ1_9LAMI